MRMYILWYIHPRHALSIDWLIVDGGNQSKLIELIFKTSLRI